MNLAIEHRAVVEDLIVEGSAHEIGSYVAVILMNLPNNVTRVIVEDVKDGLKMMHCKTCD